MAPFSTCFICQARTRKVVRDPLTLKQIYVCPKCFKSKDYKERLLKQSKTLIECKPTKEEKPTAGESQQAVALLSKPKKEKAKTVPKITPPVMQTVIINGRKYIAISEAADDD
ncbi:hypothetical protein KR009_012194 [Drosophila setifemur]|nr:hypothetical protein KR009_012194 [Drosophila setifemur]